MEVEITFTEADVSDSGTTKCHYITIIDDNIVEVSEFFSVELIGSDVIGNGGIVTIVPNVDNIDSKLVYCVS